MMKLKSKSALKAIYSILTAFALLVESSTSANADLVLEFGTMNSPTPGSISTATINVGETIDVLLYLVESNGETRLSDVGLLAAGTIATYSPTFGEVSSVALNPELENFPIEAFDNDIGTMALAGGVSFDSLTGIRGSSILIGSFSFTATSAGDTIFKFGDYEPTFSDFALFAPGFDDIDPILFGDDRLRTFDFTVQSISSVPEPSSFLFFAVGAAGVSYTSRRNRRIRGQKTK